MTMSPIPPRFARANLSELDKQLFGFVLDYAKNLKSNIQHGNGLLISGPPGVGKTYAVAALTNYRIKQSVGNTPSIIFETAYSLFDKYAAVVDPHHSSSVYDNAAWLVINDLGKSYTGGKLAEQVVYKVGRLLRTRSEKLLPTFITTNLRLIRDNSGFDTFSDVFGESIWSLVHECTDRYQVSGCDRRK